MMHDLTGYTPYGAAPSPDGRQTVLRRGEVIIQDGELMPTARLRRLPVTHAGGAAAPSAAWRRNGPCTQFRRQDRAGCVSLQQRGVGEIVLCNLPT